MSDTPPAKKTAAKKTPGKKAAAPAKRKGGGTYVPALPTGWAMQILVQGPNGHTATVVPDQGAGGVVVEFRANGEVRSRTVADMAAGCKELASGAKRIEQLTRDEARIEQARAETYAGLGEVAPAPEKAPAD